MPDKWGKAAATCSRGDLFRTVIQIRIFIIRIYLRGTIRTFRFLSLLSARWPAAQSPMVNRGVWLQISWKKKLGIKKGGKFWKREREIGKNGKVIFHSSKKKSKKLNQKQQQKTITAQEVSIQICTLGPDHLFSLLIYILFRGQKEARVEAVIKFSWWLYSHK